MALSMKKTALAVFTATTLFLSVPMAFAAGDKPTIAKTVAFKKGESSAAYSGKVQGDDYDSYYFTAKKGHMLNLDLTSSAHAEVILFGQDDYVAGDTYILPESGKYEVRVLQMRNFARRGTESPYSLTIEITNPTSSTPSSSKNSSKTTTNSSSDIQELDKTVYSCEGNKILEVVYINTPNSNYAVISQMGEMIPMTLIPMASGANYQAINQNYAYKLYTKGNNADLVGADDSPILSTCSAE